MQLESYYSEADSIIFNCPETPALVILVCQRTKEQLVLPVHASEGALKVRFDAISELIPNEVARYDLLVCGGVDDSPLEKLIVPGFSEIPLWQRYFRGETSESLLQPHVYINRKGFFSVVLRSATEVDHGERLFPYEHSIDRLDVSGDRIAIRASLAGPETGQLRVDRCYLKLESSDEMVEYGASKLVVSPRGGLEVAATIPLPADISPLRYGLYVSVSHPAFSTKIELRLSHVGRGLFSELGKAFTAPQIALSGDRIFTVSTNPRTTGISFIVRPRSQFDSSRLRMRALYGVAKIENLVRERLFPRAKPTAFLYEREAGVAQDNAYALFQHLATEQAQHSFNFCYLMEKNSPQWGRVANAKSVVKKYSYRYWRVITSSSSFGVTSEGRFHLGTLYSSADVLTRLAYSRKSYFLQHGVTAFKRVGFFKPGTATFPDGFVVTADWEKRILLDSGVPEWLIDVTGFARWDKLGGPPGQVSPVKKIVYMPTWRPWLEGRSAGEISRSSYAATIEEFLNSDALHSLLRAHNVTIQFIPHPKFKDLSKHFLKALPRVEVVDQDEVEFAELISEADLIITDYSSIAWEFVQSRKPVLLFQFDLARYEGLVGSYANKPLDKIRRRFPTAYRSESVIGQLRAILEADAETVAASADAFAKECFSFQDGDNARRIVAALERRLPALKCSRALPPYDEADVPFLKRQAKVRANNA